MNMEDCSASLKRIYGEQKEAIEKRLCEFDKLWETSDAESILHELLFCILTPQAEAHGCWEAICLLDSNMLLHTASASELAPHLHCSRFKNKKSAYLVKAREQFPDAMLIEKLSLHDNTHSAREWLVDTIQGFGFKEASHFLRNIGLGRDLAILDRHILRTLVKCNVIETMPSSMTKKKYYDIEEDMKKFSFEMGIPLAHLDFVMWYSVKHEIFK